MKLLSTSLLTLLFSAVASAGTTAVFPPQTVNVGADDARIISSVIAAKYEAVVGQRVIGPDEAGQAVGEAKSLTEAAKALGADEYLEIRAFGLDSNERSRRSLLEVTRRTQSGQPIFHTEVTLTSVADIEVAAKRVAESLHRKVSLAETRTPQNVINSETASVNSMRSRQVPSFTTSLVLPAGWTREFVPFSTTAFNLRLERERFFGNIGIGLQLSAPSTGRAQVGYGGLSADLGINYYLTEGNTAPYVGGGIMPRILTAGICPAPYGQVGLAINREASPQFFAEFRVAQNVLPVENAHPTEFGISFGVGL